MDTLDPILIEAARSDLDSWTRRNPEVAALAGVASLARSIEPELLRALRIGLGTRISGTRISVSAESALWFSSFVESRGTDAITLLPEALHVLRPLLADDRQLLEDARTIVEDCHKSAPDVLQWEERIVYLALTDQTALLEEEIRRGLRSVSQGTRQPLVSWISDMWLRLPPAAKSNPLLVTLYQHVRGLVRRQSQSASSRESSSTDLLFDFSAFPTRELGVVLGDNRFIIGDVPEAEFGIAVPDLEPVELDVAFGSGNSWVEQWMVKRRQVVEIDIQGHDTIRVRTLAGRIHELAVSFFRPPKAKRISPRVFISYSHDSPEHGQRVLGLAERLRADGIQSFIDQFVNGQPQQGWPRWQQDQIEKADYVLVVCTETFYRRFVRDPAQSRGWGTDWETQAIAREINSSPHLAKFIPVGLTRADENWLPIPLHGSTYYDLTSANAYAALLGRLTDQPRSEEPFAEGAQQEIIERLSAVDIFSPLSVEEIEKLAAAAVHHVFAPGEFVIRAGDQGASMFVVHSGRVQIQVNEGGKARPIAVLEEGAFFGEMSLFTGEPRTADITALEESEVLEIGHAAMKNLFEANPHLAESISWTIAERRTGLTEPAEAEMAALLSAIKRFFQNKEAARPTGTYDTSRIDKYAPAELIGREEEIKFLADAWEKVVRGEPGRPHILTLVGLGGEGKTSLVAKWAADFAQRDWPGCEAAFAWSFYSQGASEQVSSDSFLKEALNFFGDPAMANSSASAFDKGRRLAQMVGERRVLLILDGLEPLQSSPASPMGGELKDAGMTALLKALATNSRGLCVITTRYSIPDLPSFWETSTHEIELSRLSREAGVHLLRLLGVMGTQTEFEKLVDDVKGHALTLNLIGNYLRDAHDGDIRKRDLLNLEEADSEEFGGSGFRMYSAYIGWLESEGEKGKRAVAMLRLLGLFDRPAIIELLNVLWHGEVITGLTEPLIGLSETERNLSIKRLEEIKLLTVIRHSSSGRITAIDAHPRLREYLAKQLRSQQPGAWRSAHRRLYEHITKTTTEGSEPTLEDLQPLAQAIRAGCEAGLHQEAFDEIYIKRLQRGNEGYLWRKLGAFGSDLGVVSAFFEEPWRRVSPALSQEAQAFLFHHAAFDLRALGRLTEALEPMRSALEMQIKQSDWKNASTSAGNLCELELTLGEISSAVRDAEQALSLADRIGDAFQRGARRENMADAYHQSGRRAEAESLFREAEQSQARRNPDYPLLYSTGGFRYCDLLLGEPERAAWRTTLNLQPQLELKRLAALCQAVMERATTTSRLMAYGGDLLSPALEHLTLVRAAMYLSILRDQRFDPKVYSEIDAAVDGLRRAGQQPYLPPGLLMRAFLQSLTVESFRARAEEDLDEAWEIAERGPMKLFMADIHLYRARLFHAVKPYPWNKFADGGEGRGPKDDLADARKLIEQCGYWRRKEELEDAEEAARNWT